VTKKEKLLRDRLIKEALEHMRIIKEKEDDDPEHNHTICDSIIQDILEELGCGEVVKMYNSIKMY
jgi:hypothetical protein